VAGPANITFGTRGLLSGGVNWASIVSFTAWDTGKTDRLLVQFGMSLLPQEPLLASGLHFAGHCEPAREVGGDYYDFFPLGADRVGVLIADVSGKGTSAALYMAELKGLVLSLSKIYQ
jgi:hypothetical protein